MIEDNTVRIVYEARTRKRKQRERLRRIWIEEIKEATEKREIEWKKLRKNTG